MIALIVIGFGLGIQSAQAESLDRVSSQAAFDQQPTSASTTSDPGYLLGANDEIRISVYGQPALSVATRINADGTIGLAFIGPIEAAGKTTAQLAAEIGAAYVRGGYLVDPSVSVQVAQYVSRFVTVLGSVNRAGNYPLERPYTVAAMVAQAGGVKEDGASVVLLTPGDGSASVRISLSDLTASIGRQLQPGDILVVPPAEKVYVYGQVQRPGGFNVVDGLTYRQALALAGGPTLAGSTRRLRVQRGKQRLSNLNLDDQVQPDDVLIIPEKLF